MKQRERSSKSSDGLLISIAMQLRGVMGRLSEAADVPLTGNYERDREVCEEAIRKAQAELEAAGENADPKSNAFDVAWAWRNLDEAYIRLAHMESRVHLARRRAILKQQADEKAKLAQP